MAAGYLIRFSGLILALSGLSQALLGCANVATQADGGGGSSGEGAGKPTSQCAPFRDEASPGTLTLRFQNQRTEPIYVGNIGRCEQHPKFELHQNERKGIDPLDCGNSCQDYQDDTANECSNDCPSFPLTRIEPGASFDFPYDARYYEEVPMPVDCVKSAQAPNGYCSAAKPILEGLTVIRSEFFIEQQCKKNTGGGACTCDVGSGSVCEVTDFYLTGSSVDLEVELQWPSETVALLVAI